MSIENLRPAAPSAILRAATTERCGYAVSWLSGTTPKSMASRTRGSAVRSAMSAALYAVLTSCTVGVCKRQAREGKEERLTSQPTTMRQGGGLRSIRINSATCLRRLTCEGTRLRAARMGRVVCCRTHDRHRGS
jgi:hypothetical protein